MRILGLTGGIACGKSNVSAWLSEQGAVIIDGDLLSRELTAPGGEALPALRSAFGDGVFDGEKLNRRALGALVFADGAQREKLDAVMQPLLRRLILRRIDEARANGASVCVLDMPLLYEKGLDALCDTVWCVWLPEDKQLERLMARDGFTREEAEQRLRSQLPALEKAARADTVIDTSGTIEETRLKLPALWQSELGEGGIRS